MLANGSTLYVGGWFTTIGVLTRRSAAEIDASTGIATAWDPNGQGPVYTMVVSGESMYVGGGFKE